MKAEPQKEHQWLERFVGEWTLEGEGAEPGKPSEHMGGTDTVRSLGGLWVVCEGEGNMPEGGSMASIMTLGYDPMKRKFVGTFIASVMAQLWVYEGELDESGNVLTLDTEGPSFAGDGKLAKYQDVIEFKSDDHRVLTSRHQGEDGSWTEFMTAHYRRKK